MVLRKGATKPPPHSQRLKFLFFAAISSGVGGIMTSPVLDIVSDGDRARRDESGRDAAERRGVCMEMAEDIATGAGAGGA